MISENYSMEVPFFDVDSMNIVWHGNYVKYFELARCKLLDKIGYNYRDMASSGFAFPIVDMRIKYVKPILFGQNIDIVASLEEWQVRLKINYQVLDQNTREKLTTGHTIQAAIDMQSQEMKFECPQVLVDKIANMGV